MPKTIAEPEVPWVRYDSYEACKGAADSWEEEIRAGSEVADWLIEAIDGLRAYYDACKKTGKPDHSLLPEKLDDKLFHEACQDEFVTRDAYESVCEAVTEWMKERKTTEWLATVENFGWRHQSGSKEFTAKTGRKLLQEVLPNTECSYTIHLHPDHLHINNAHHDAPTGGEIYIIEPKCLIKRKRRRAA